ncbi:MAG: hypothetical protein K1X33_02750 [Methanobacteriaceae archaeon]|nr:hypothetical protein [Methanobacteriaceae archaeon]
MLSNQEDRERIYNRLKEETSSLEYHLNQHIYKHESHLHDFKEILRTGKNILKDLEIAYTSGYISDETYEIFKYLLIQIMDLMHSVNKEKSIAPKILKELHRINEIAMGEIKPK